MSFPVRHPFPPINLGDPVNPDRLLDPTSFVRTQGWRIWEPEASGLTVGNGVFTGAYLLLERQLVEVVFDFTFGSTSTFTGLLELAVPVPESGMYNANTAVGTAHIRDGASASYECAVYLTPGSGLVVRVLGTAGNHANYVTVSDTVPMAWASGDTLRGSARYRPA